MPRLRHTTAALMPGFATLGDVVDDIVNEARASNKYFWWELPGLEKFAPKNIGTFYANSTLDPVGYLKMLDEVNRATNRGGNYFMGRVQVLGNTVSWPAGPIPSFERFTANMSDDQKQAVWRWLWGMDGYTIYAPTNVGVAYVQMRSEEAVRRLAAQGVTDKEELKAAAVKAAATADEASVYQEKVAIQNVKTAASNAEKTVKNYEAPAKALGIKNPFEFLTKLSLGIKIAAGVATVVVGTVLIRSFTRR